MLLFIGVVTALTPTPNGVTAAARSRGVRMEAVRPEAIELAKQLNPAIGYWDPLGLGPLQGTRGGVACPRGCRCEVVAALWRPPCQSADARAFINPEHDPGGIAGGCSGAGGRGGEGGSRDRR